jgi:hypothetical protein
MMFLSAPECWNNMLPLSLSCSHFATMWSHEHSEADDPALLSCIMHAKCAVVMRRGQRASPTLGGEDSNCMLVRGVQAGLKDRQAD